LAFFVANMVGMLSCAGRKCLFCLGTAEALWEWKRRGTDTGKSRWDVPLVQYKISGFNSERRQKQTNLQVWSEHVFSVQDWPRKDCDPITTLQDQASQ
jgi:hypothetical protein